jgi:hypothetical protein
VPIPPKQQNGLECKCTLTEILPLLLLKTPIHASLLLILNEDGLVLSFKIVPNDQRSFVQELLEEIWSTPDMEQITSVVYTDNPKVDGNYVKSAFQKCHPDQPIGVEVLQDIYHAKMRVLKEMPKNHVDYRAAKSDLTTIFSNLQVKGHYYTTDDFREALNEWVEKYSVVYSFADMTTTEKLKALGSKPQKYIYHSKKKN